MSHRLRDEGRLEVLGHGVYRRSHAPLADYELLALLSPPPSLPMTSPTQFHPRTTSRASEASGTRSSTSLSSDTASTPRLSSSDVRISGSTRNPPSACTALSAASLMSSASNATSVLKSPMRRYGAGIAPVASRRDA